MYTHVLMMATNKYVQFRMIKMWIQIWRKFTQNVKLYFYDGKQKNQNCFDIITLYTLIFIKENVFEKIIISEFNSNAYNEIYN